MKSGLFQVIATLVLTVALVLPGSGQGQEANKPQAARIIGVVTVIDAATRHLTLKTDAGTELQVQFQDATSFMRIAPGEKDLRNATTIELGDLKAGDRVLARGRLADDKKSMAVSSVIVMTQADLAKKHEADRAEWQNHGIAGTITALNPAAKQITISVQALSGSKPVVVGLIDGASMRRYAPDSVKFSDAKPSRFDELKVGDEVKALGNKSEDGGRFTAEELVSGSFRNIAATVNTVNAADKTLLVTDLVTNKRLTVRIDADSNVKRLPPQFAQAMAWRVGSAGNGGGSAAPGAPGRPPGGGFRRTGEGGAAGGPGGPGGAGGMMLREGPRDLQSMLEKMPALTLAELKTGDSIIVASTNGADPTKVTAITVLAGVEPIFAAAQQGGRSMNLGSWNLGMDMGGGAP